MATRALIGIAALALPLAATVALAQRASDSEETATIRARMQQAQRDSAAAGERSKQLEAEAKVAIEAADITAREAAALAARIQQAEAGIAAAEARMSLIARERGALDRRLAERREPLVKLTGALQKLSRRPLVLSALRPGSLRETVYLRAMLESTIPQVRARTAALRAEIERGRALEREAQQALAVLRKVEGELSERRQRLAAVETRQRLESRRAGGNADREVERALALAEEARDLDALVERLGEAGSLRKELAALPGPAIRPRDPGNAPDVTSLATGTGAPRPTRIAFQLPVSGSTVAGFGELGSSGVRSSGLTLAPRDGAQVIAPAAGRVAFAGPYRGYDRIVIIEHEGGMTSLVTGLARTDVAVGDLLVSGAPLGIAGINRPRITLEVRRGGKPINPLSLIR